MKKVLFTLLIVSVSVATNYSHSQIGSGLKDKLTKKKKDKSKPAKDIGVDIIEDEAGISGTYYVWYPPSVENSYFKKIPKVAIQYKPEDGKKLTMYASKKEFLEYYTDDFVRSYNMTEICGLYSFDSRNNGPGLWTVEPGVFISLDIIETNSVTCEFEKFTEPGYKTYIMSKDKAMIDGMTLEKFQEIVKAQKIQDCECYKDYKMDKNPPPTRGMVSASVEEAGLEKVKARANREGWTEEILGVYVSSAEWTKEGLWVSSTGDWSRSDRVNAVIVMKDGNTCSYQRMVLATNETEFGKGGEGYYDKEGINIIGVVPENRPMSCSKAEEMIK